MNSTRPPRSPVLRFCLLALMLLLLGGCAGQVPLPGGAKVSYELGERYYRQGKLHKAIDVFQQIQNDFPDSEYARLALLRVGDCNYRLKDLDEANTAYTDFIKFNLDHPQAPYAYYQLGMTYFKRISTIDVDLNPIIDALGTFQEALAKFPSSPPYTEKIIQRINDCKRIFAKRDFYVGLFYFKQKRYQAASGRFRHLLKYYPGFIDDKVLYYLGLSCLNDGKKEEAQKAFLTLTKGYSRSPYAAKARGLIGREKGPGVKLSFLVYDYFIAHQDDPNDQYLTTIFTPGSSSPRMTAIFAGQSPAPAPEKVTFASLFREHAAVRGQPATAGNVPIPDWQQKRGKTAAKAAPTATGRPPGTGKASRQAPVDNLREPLEIISDWTEADRKAGTITFGGKVIAKQRDMVLYADRLTNYFDLDTQSLIRAVASGNVKMSQADKFVTCEQATLEQDKRLIVLRGNVVMWQADNRVTGDKIIVHLDSKQAEVFGGRQGKAKVRITPKQR